MFKRVIVIKRVYKVFLIVLVSFLFFSCTKKEDAEFNYLRAVEAYSKQDFETALEFVNAAKKNDSFFYQADLLKAKIFYFQDMLEDANLVLHKSIRKYPEYTDARIWYIRVLIAQERYDEAETALIKELSFNSGDCRVFYQYGSLCAKLGRIDERLSMYRKAESLLSENSKIYLELADIWLMLGMRERALDELDKAEVVMEDSQTIKELKRYIRNGNDSL